MTSAAVRKISVFHISLLTVLYAFALCALGHFSLFHYYMIDNDISLWDGYGTGNMLSDIYQTYLSLIDDAALIDERLSTSSRILKIYFVFSLCILCVFTLYRKIDTIKNRYNLFLFYGIFGSIILVSILSFLQISAEEGILSYYVSSFLACLILSFFTYVQGKLLAEYSSTGILRLNPSLTYFVYPVILLKALYSSIP